MSSIAALHVNQFIASYTAAGDKKEALEGYSAIDLTSLINDFKNDERFPLADPHLLARRRELAHAFSYPQLNRWYHRASGMVITALIISGIVTFFLVASNHLMSFPQDFLHAVTHINYMNLGIGSGVACVWVGGAAFVIYRAVHKKEHLLELRSWQFQKIDEERGEIIEVEVNDIAKLSAQPLRGDEFKKSDKIILPAPHRGSFLNVEKHLETVVVDLPAAYSVTWVDKSTLDENQSGMAFGYTPKDCTNHYAVATEVALLATPFYLIGTMAYNAIRTAVIPFYILSCMALEAVLKSPEGNKNKSPLTGDRKFTFWDIPEQMFLSIRRVIQAPFYALAYLFALLLAQFSPMAGRKLASAIERDWNDGISLAEGLWVIEPRRLWKFEGGGGPSKLGRKSLYITGCYFPEYFLRYEGGEIVAVYHIIKAESGIGSLYRAFSSSELEAAGQTEEREKFFEAYQFLNKQAATASRSHAT